MSQVNLKKVTFTIRKVETITVEISEDNGFDMPENVPELVRMVNEINRNPCIYNDNVSGWETESAEAVDIEYFESDK